MGSVGHQSRERRSAPDEAMALYVIRVEDEMITEIITFPPTVFEEFGLPSKI